MAATLGLSFYTINVFDDAFLVAPILSPFLCSLGMWIYFKASGGNGPFLDFYKARKWLDYFVFISLNIYWWYWANDTYDS